MLICLTVFWFLGSFESELVFKGNFFSRKEFIDFLKKIGYSLIHFKIVSVAFDLESTKRFGFFCKCSIFYNLFGVAPRYKRL